MFTLAFCFVNHLTVKPIQVTDFAVLLVRLSLNFFCRSLITDIHYLARSCEAMPEVLFDVLVSGIE